MNTAFKTQCIPDYRLLTEEQIKEIHQATLTLLEKTGVKVLNQEALQLLGNAGCRLVDEDIVRIPAGLVEESIQRAPSHVTVYNRDGEPAMELGGSNVYFGMGTDLLNTWDLKSGEIRPSCLQDVVDSAIVGDYCQEIDFIASNAFPLDGCNLVHDVGYLGQGLVGSVASLVMCSEIISYVRRIQRGFDISRERIGLDVIHEMGPGGNFLAHEQTLKYCREEHWTPRFVNRQSPETWKKNNGKRYSEVVVEKALDILANHKPDRLPDAAIKGLDSIFEKATVRLSDEQFFV